MMHQSPHMSSPAPRVAWVDIAKGICIVLVVMMHTTFGLEKATGEIGWMHAVVAFAKPFRMPDFFLISGLFLAMTIDRPWRLYLDRKVVHFFYFYFLWVGIQFAFKAPFLMADGHSIGTIARTLLFSIIQPFGTLWFIYMLPVFFVVTKLFRSKPWHLFGFAILLQVLPINTEAIWVEIIGLCGVVGIDNHWVLVDEFCSFFVYFLAGYLFAPKLFALAHYAQANSGKALGLLTAWFLINLGLVYASLAGLPVVSLLLGGAGAVAIVVAASLLARFAAGSALNHLGARSIVVYLAFFIPMVVARLAFTKLVPGLDAGTMAALSTLFAVVAPLIGYAVINRIGVGQFLFTRPDWAKLTGTFRARAPSIQPAE
ncbi:MAG: acyltransferase family protein [Rhizobiaceae bacterium]